MVFARLLVRPVIPVNKNVILTALFAENCIPSFPTTLWLSGGFRFGKQRPGLIPKYICPLCEYQFLNLEEVAETLAC